MITAMRIHVKTQHIEQGKRGWITQCPIALALRDATGKSYTVTGAYISTRDGSYSIPSRKCRRFVIEFDAGRPVKPFYFTFDTADN